LCRSIFPDSSAMVKIVFASLLTAAAAGGCNSADQAVLADASTVGDKQDACGKKALTLIPIGINHDKFVNCLEADLALSASCAECYYTVAEYGAKNCKAACLLGWCKSGCLTCTQSAQDALSGCTGFSPAVASPCLESTGGCSSADQAALADASVVGDKQDACGKKALSLKGINHDKYVNCVEDGLGVSAGCAECYYTVADYGFKNCKAACLLGWCKSGCLSCTQPAQDGLSGCTGFTPSVASPCLEMEPNATSGKCEDNCKAVLTGMLNGLLSDSEDFDTCSLDGLQEVLMLAASVEDLKEKKVLDFFTDLSVALGKIEPTVGDCKVVGSEVKKLLGALKAASPAHLAANVKTHHTEIYEAVAAWSEARDAEDYKTTGEQLGKIIRKVLEEDGAAMV